MKIERDNRNRHRLRSGKLQLALGLQTLLVFSVAIFHPAVWLIDCHDLQQAVRFGGEAAPGQETSNNIDEQQQQQTSVTQMSADNTQHQPIRQDEENALPLAHRSTTGTAKTPSHRLGVAKLERRLDRLEFEFLKSMHQIKTSKSDFRHLQNQLADASGRAIASSSELNSNGQQTAASSADSVDRIDGEGAESSSSKLIDLSERLNLVEKFITITTTKVYELEQALVRLQQCDCRKSCKWRPRPLAVVGKSAPTLERVSTRGNFDGHDSTEDDNDEQEQADGRHKRPQRAQANMSGLKEDGQVWRDESDKCNVCSCHRGRVSCRRVSCPALQCDRPQVVPGKCCPVCLKSCFFKGRSVKHGHKLVINSNEQTCKECLCLDGRFKCQSLARQQRAARMQRETQLGAAASSQELAEDNYLETDLIEFGDKENEQRQQVAAAAGEDLEREFESGSESNRARRSSGGTTFARLGNELEKDDGFERRPVGSSSNESREQQSPLFCPLVECELSKQFQLDNDCCTYCRGFDFCSYDYLANTGQWAKASRCPPNSICTNRNTNSSSQPDTPIKSVSAMFSCQCKRGFKENGHHLCVDIDECESEHLNDCDTNTTICQNSLGSFKCKCRPGFKPMPSQSAVVWLDLDSKPEVELSADDSASKLQTNLDDDEDDDNEDEPDGRQSFRRKQRTVQTVQAGERRLLQRCQDIDECADGLLNRCHSHARCINLAGSYKCQCKRGYLGNGFECHKWFKSSPNVAAYLHRHHEDDHLSDDEQSDAQNQIAHQIRSSKLQLSPGDSSTWVPLPPLNTLDEDDEDEQQISWLASPTLQQRRPNRNPEPNADQHWLEVADSFPQPRAEPQQAAGNQSVYNESREVPEEPTGSATSLNTRTMFLQPPPPVDRPRPWWQNSDPAMTLTVSSEPSSDRSSDVTEKQMASAGNRFSSMADSNQSDTTDHQRRTGSTNVDAPTSTTMRPAEQNTQQAINTQQRPTPPTGPASKSGNGSQTLASVTGHKKGAIIASASTSPGRGSRPSSNGRSSYSSYGQPKQFRSLGASTSSPSSSSSASPSILPPHYLTAVSRQSGQLAMIFKFKQTLSLVQYFLPTIASAMLVLIYSQSTTNRFRINQPSWV